MALEMACRDLTTLEFRRIVMRGCWALPYIWKTMRTCVLVSAMPLYISPPPQVGEHNAIHPLCLYRQHLSQPDGGMRTQSHARSPLTDSGEFGWDRSHPAPLFNDICHGRSEPLLDVWEAIPTWETDLDAARHYAFQVMEYIWAYIPCLLQNLGTYLTVERAE